LPRGNSGSSVDLGLIQLVKKTDGEDTSGYAPISLLGSADNVTIGRTGTDSPAARMGFKPGDVVVAVDGKSTAGVGPDGLRELLAGRPNEAVVVTVRGQNDDRRDIQVGRVSGR
jgi:C-terminal processing protease CtpA/Prc